jgi:hypothetical protein
MAATATEASRSDEMRCWGTELFLEEEPRRI